MTLSIQSRKAEGQVIHAPCFICDHCGEPITNTAQGIVDYGHVDKDQPASDFRILHNHFPDGRTACSLYYQQVYNSVMLEDFMSQLLNNIKHSPRAD